MMSEMNSAQEALTLQFSTEGLQAAKIPRGCNTAASSPRLKTHRTWADAEKNSQEWEAGGKNEDVENHAYSSQLSDLGLKLPYLH